MRGPHKVHVIDGATHLFEERDTLQQVADEAANWFLASFPVSRTNEPVSAMAGRRA
jgi:hypothetical protein